MASKRNDVWENDSDAFTEAQVYSVLATADIDVANDTQNDFVCYCPFHGNSFSPAMTVSKEKGIYFCHTPGCGASGTLEYLLQQIKGMNPFQAKRVVLKAGTDSTRPFEERFAEVTKVAEFKEYTEMAEHLGHNTMWPASEGLDYLHGRGFTDDTIREFGLGYNDDPPYRRRAHPKMVFVPMHDPTGKMKVGYIGRSIEGKEFWNTPKLPKRETAWNFHRAKRAGSKVIIVEASFDAMRVHQAGYPNVVALLGGHLSGWHIDQLNRTFDTVVIMTDFDKYQLTENCRRCPGGMCVGHRPGMDLARNIIRDVPKRIMWASYEEGAYFPEGCKDVGDMTDDQIRQCLRNARSNVEFQSWGLDLWRT